MQVLETKCPFFVLIILLIFSTWNKCFICNWPSFFGDNMLLTLMIDYFQKD